MWAGSLFSVILMGLLSVWPLGASTAAQEGLRSMALGVMPPLKKVHDFPKEPLWK